eukprot:TRINITY_DN49813_c0_g1_i1.p1 TRINITY_DN49813_c0_g1~~TRINITY_DN49813_c0_g1_i1.p1  ORF type:complete len:272 (-),score=4.41 TRINITY_DN49813_c0_g1_i1:67-825(-)
MSRVAACNCTSVFPSLLCFYAATSLVFTYRLKKAHRNAIYFIPTHEELSEENMAITASPMPEKADEFFAGGFAYTASYGECAKYCADQQPNCKGFSYCFTNCGITNSKVCILKSGGKPCSETHKCTANFYFYIELLLQRKNQLLPRSIVAHFLSSTMLKVVQFVNWELVLYVRVPNKDSWLMEQRMVIPSAAKVQSPGIVLHWEGTLAKAASPLCQIKTIHHARWKRRFVKLPSAVVDAFFSWYMVQTSRCT